jgi:hypothetical protein
MVYRVPRMLRPKLIKNLMCMDGLGEQRRHICYPLGVVVDRTDISAIGGYPVMCTVYMGGDHDGSQVS